MSGIGRNTMRKLVDVGKAPRAQSGPEDDHPKGYAGELYDGQSGKKPSQSGRRPGGALRMDAALKRPRRLRAKYTPRTNLAICTRGISLLRRACVSVLALTDRGAAGNRPALSGVVPPLRRRDNIRGRRTGDEGRENGGERWHGTALSRCRSCPMSREEYPISQTPSDKSTCTPLSPQGKI